MALTRIRERMPFEITKANVENITLELRPFLSGYVQVGPKKYLITRKYEEEADIYYNFEARPSDIYIAGFPRCGTTLMQELVWLLTHNLDYELASQSILAHRCPYLERSITFNEREHKEIGTLKDTKNDGSHVENVKKLTVKSGWELLDNVDKGEQRLMKSHLPLSLLPQNILQVGCKVIYIARNPKDVAVSYYHLNNLFKHEGYQLTFAQHWELFQKGLIPFAPYIEHVKEAWAKRNEKHLLFVFYEDLNKNFRNTVSKIANFISKDLSEADLDGLEEHFKIENFRKNKSVNNEYLQKAGILNPNTELNFIRKGVVGDWKTYFDEDLNSKANQWLKENLKGTDLTFLE